MGYYSDAALALTGKGVDTLDKKLAAPETSEETRKEVQDLLSQADHHWAWSKWYSNFPEVAFVESLMDEMDEEDYRFIRIGEDYDDTEVRGGFWENPFDMELSRNIVLAEAG